MSRKTRIRLAAASMAASVIVAAFMGGCGAGQDPVERFFAAGGQDHVSPVLEAQAARGAREDATLYAHHFDGEALSALGTRKVELMLRDQGHELPLVVYLDLRDGDGLTAGRRSAVRRHLEVAGLSENQFRLESGANPATLHGVTPALTGLKRMDAAAGEGQGADSNRSLSGVAPAGGQGDGMR